MSSRVRTWPCLEGGGAVSLGICFQLGGRGGKGRGREGKGRKGKGKGGMQDIAHLSFVEEFDGNADCGGEFAHAGLEFGKVRRLWGCRCEDRERSAFMLYSGFLTELE